MSQLEIAFAADANGVELTVVDLIDAGCGVNQHLHFDCAPEIKVKVAHKVVGFDTKSQCSANGWYNTWVHCNLAQGAHLDYLVVQDLDASISHSAVFTADLARLSVCTD